MIRLQSRSIALTVGLMLVISLLVTCAQSLFAAELKPRYGGTLMFSDQSEEMNIGYPPKMSKTLSFRQGAPAVETLFRFDKAGKLVPWLATTFKEDAKARTIILTLRKGVKFHDGTEFNGEAVKWNLDQSVAARAMGTEKLKSVEVVNDYTVRLILTEWDSTLMSNLAMFLGMMVSPNAYKKNGEEWCLQNPVGTGPFQFVSRQKDVRTVYRKFDGYWQKGKPYLDRVEYTPMTDNQTREFSLRRGELNLMGTFVSNTIATLEKDGFKVARATSGSGARCFVPDSANPNSPFANLRVRQATQYAIDSGAIVKGIFSGENELTNQLNPKGHWAYNPSVVGYPYNPARARQLLKEAGYPNGFKTKLTYRSDSDNDKVYVAIQGFLKEVGIDAELDPIQSGRWNQVLTGAKWEGLYMGHSLGNPDSVVMLAQLYSSSASAFKQMYIPPEYDKAIQNAIMAPDFKAKQKWTREASKLMIDKYALLFPLYCIKDFAVSNPSLHQHGWMESAYTAQWTPEDAWLER
jgi:peptide/nickel transport system substrate-binding protein